MKLSLFSLVSLALSASASRLDLDFSLVGYAKDNPLGPTTGGASKDGKTITVTNVADFIQAVNNSEPTVVYAKGSFNFSSRVRIGSHKTLVGVGKHGASITGAGLNLFNATNIIVRNFHLTAIPDDAITIRNSTRIWIDHNEFSTGSFPALGPDAFDGQVDIIRASDWITLSWNFFHDHWKSSLVGNSDALRATDLGTLHITYHHNYWRNEGTRGPAARFGHQHIFNNLYEHFRYQAIHSRSDNQLLVEGNVFRGKSREALSTYGLVIPEDSPNTSPEGDYELDGFANLGARNDWGGAGVNITQVGNFTQVPYGYRLTPLEDVKKVVRRGAGVGKI
ncbi:hypothetical protein IAQ61_000241 [Plenodomus lingam]|nr:hypothetical protein IAQ61_000241 [Plenodomus lingam]